MTEPCANLLTLPVGSTSNIQHYSDASFLTSTMASWHDLPAEIKLLIIRNYIDLLLPELGVEMREWHEYSLVRLLIMRLVYALPLLRNDVVRIRDALELMCYETLEIKEYDWPTAKMTMVLGRDYDDLLRSLGEQETV